VERLVLSVRQCDSLCSGASHSLRPKIQALRSEGGREELVRAHIHDGIGAAVSVDDSRIAGEIGAWQIWSSVAARINGGRAALQADISACDKRWACRNVAVRSGLVRTRETGNIPELERLDIRSATIIRTNERRDKWVENATGYSALIIEFRNKHAERGKEGAIAKSVVARLVFTPRNAKRIINNAACWLEEIVQGATIDPGEVRKLVIAVDLKQEGRLFTLFNPRERLPIYYSQFAAGKERVRPIEPNELSAVPCDVELTLISENLTLYNKKYELTAHDGVMQLVPKKQ
jgi:hypothetical protein